MPARRPLATSLLALAASLLASPAIAASFTYVQQGTALTYFKGYQTPAAQWITPSFSEASPWIASSSGFGIGYGDGDDNTALSDMSGNYQTVYVRSHFHVGTELSSLQHLTLLARFDDGFVAYLNGTEIGRASVPTGALQASAAASDHEVTAGDVTLDVNPSLLVQGDNVLAVEVHNVSLSSSDLSFIPTLWAADASPTIDASITIGPFLQQVGRTSALVVWETDIAAPSTVSFGSTTALGQTAQESNAVLHHVVRLEGLQPASTHYYRVDSAKLSSPVGKLITEPNLADPIRIGLLGDTRSNNADHASVIAAMLQDGPYHLVLDTGDLVADGAQASLWTTFFSIEKDLLRDAPMYPVLGNHEGTGPSFTSIFELPADSTAPERYYSLRYGPVLVIGMDEYTSAYNASSAEYGWLQQTLAAAAQDPSIRHKIVELHSGPYDSGSHGSNMTVRNDLVPLFDQYGVTMVVSGHDHDYERSTVNGIKYVVSGGGGAPLYSVPGDWWTEVAESTLHYCVLDVLGPRIDVTCKRPDGSQLDHYVIGEGLSECATPADCSAVTHGDCGPQEKGEWACVAQGCIWNCTASTPPQPDGGTGGGGTGGGGTGGGAGAGGAAGTPDGGLGTGGPAPGNPALPASSSDDSSGCACQTTGGTRSAAGLAWLLAIGAVVARSRRRSVR